MDSTFSWWMAVSALQHPQLSIRLWILEDWYRWLLFLFLGLIFHHWCQRVVCVWCQWNDIRNSCHLLALDMNFTHSISADTAGGTREEPCWLSPMTCLQLLQRYCNGGGCQQCCHRQCQALGNELLPWAETCHPTSRGDCKDERSAVSRDVISEVLKESNCQQSSRKETARELLIDSYCQVIWVWGKTKVSNIHFTISENIYIKLTVGRTGVPSLQVIHACKVQ